MSVNNSTLVAVSAYEGDKHQVENNLPVYLHHNCQVLVLSPEDAPITSLSDPRVVCRSAGLKGWIGPHSLERHCKFLKILLEFPQEHFLFHDADSVCLASEIPQYLYDSSDVIWSNQVLDTHSASSYLPKIAMQPPYFLSRKTIQGMLNCAGNPPASYYGDLKSPDGWPLPHPTFCIDHFMLQLSVGSGFPSANFLDGASFETTSDLGKQCMSDQVGILGKIMIHQVKTKEVLAQLLLDRQRYLTRPQ